MNPEFQFIENETLFFFDEIQDCINCATSLKSFHIDGDMCYLFWLSHGNQLSRN